MSSNRSRTRSAGSRSCRSRRPSAREEFDAWRGLIRLRETVMREIDRRLQSRRSDLARRLRRPDHARHRPGAELRMSDLGAQRMLTPSGITRVVVRLEEQGLVRREPDPADGRAAFAALTRPGLEALRLAQVVHHATVRELYLGRLTSTTRPPRRALREGTTRRRQRFHLAPTADERRLTVSPRRRGPAAAGKAPRRRQPPVVVAPDVGVDDQRAFVGAVDDATARLAAALWPRLAETGAIETTTPRASPVITSNSWRSLTVAWWMWPPTINSAPESTSCASTCVAAGDRLLPRPPRRTDQLVVQRNDPERARRRRGACSSRARAARR